ncbi:MAG: hypothetical protein KIT43_07455 [Bauldia sp.]|nr:hypothetical protein [Bauldia sp.]MCW5718386.1 hypothetical protein [Bauldia sp.]
MTIKRTILAAVCAAPAFLPLAAAANSPTPFDGGWSVAVTSPTASCDLPDAVPIRVSGGAVRYDGWFGPRTTGEVHPNGSLAVSISYRSDIVNVSGVLSGTSGSGRWVSPTLDCGGTWVATRG